jgi:hypothetical protein
VAAPGIHQDDLKRQIPLQVLDDRVLGRLEIEVIDPAEGGADLIEEPAGFPEVFPLGELADFGFFKRADFILVK